MLKYKNVVIMIAEHEDRNKFQYTVQCLKDIAKRTNTVNITKGYTEEIIGMVSNVEFKQNKLICDVEINEKLLDGATLYFKVSPENGTMELYPAVKLYSDSYKTALKNRDEHTTITNGKLISVGMCDNNADSEIKPIKITKEDTKNDIQNAKNIN